MLHKVYVLVEAGDYSYRGVFGNMSMLLAMVDDERARDPEGWKYNLTSYLDHHFVVVHAEVQGGPNE